MEDRETILGIINQATGTTQYHKYSSIPFFPVLTDGVKALAEAAECFWFLDVIGSYQTDPELDKAFQVWTLVRDIYGDGALIQGFNDTTLVIDQRIEYTDFPLDEIELFLCNGVLMIPSEY